MLIASIRLALDRLRANAARSALTVVGVVIGVGAIVTLVAVGNGSAADVRDQFAGLGVNTLTVVGGRGFGGGLRGAAGTGTPLTMADATALTNSRDIAAAAPVVQRALTVAAGSASETADVQGTTPNAARIDHLSLRSGSFFNKFASQRGLRVAVLGATLASDLGLDPATAIGTAVDLGGVRYVIVGILQPQGGIGFLNPDSNALVPLKSMTGTLVGAAPTLSQVRVAAASGAEARFGDSVTSTLRTSHNLATTAANDFLIINPTTLVQARQSSSDSLTRLVTVVAAISLIVGGIGIANVMLVAVRERTREIGVRRAVGARRRDILVQFVTEATVLSLLGGVLGVIGGLTVAYLLPMISDQRTEVSYWAALIAFAASGVVGIVAGIGPASQAAGLAPAAALRYE